MTAVVGILNKQAIAIAADSAVTIGGVEGNKIFNKANKVFTLSKKHPVGIMIYNSASFMLTPWETIIKVYREQLHDKSFPRVRDYQENFIDFLREKNFYTDNETQLLFLENFALEIINVIINEVAKSNKQIIENPNLQNKEKLIELIAEQVDIYVKDWSVKENLCQEFREYSFADFINYSQGVFNNININRFIENGIEIPDELLLKIKELVYYVLKTKEDILGFTGLVFVGFGEEEIYPQLIPVNISLLIDNKLRYYIDEEQGAVISNKNDAAICRFAQTDVIDTILMGVDPTLDTIYLNNFNDLFNKYNKAILESIGETNPLLSEQIKNLSVDAIVNEFNNINQQIKRKKYIEPLVGAVSSLGKDDLAEMAESLIYLTYLKRRITFAEESVGGPVDVAIISKGDGFVWIKRKHYFRPELNQQFFNNYFKK